MKNQRDLVLKEWLEMLDAHRQGVATRFWLLWGFGVFLALVDIIFIAFMIWWIRQ